MPRIAFVVLFLCLTYTAQTGTETTRVVYIHDADTYVALLDGRAETIRLKGIDCPENGESKGPRAKKFAVQTILGKNVTIKTYGKDKYGRTIAEVYLSNGILFNRQLVQSRNCKWGR
jgi:micrococcal nuclease